MTRLLSLGWMLCLTAALWVAARTPPAHGYELALADAFPPLLWALTIASALCSAGLLLLLAARAHGSRWWVSGALGGVLTNSFLVSLPLFRGYVVSDRADALNHIGYVRDILITGSLNEVDFYPGMHLLQLAIEAVGGATPGQALVLINLLFVPVWTLGLVMLVRELSGDERAAYVAAAFATPFALLWYHTMALPSTLSAMLLPILVALHLRRNRTAGWEQVATIAVEILLAFLIVYFHPMTTVYAIILLLAFGGAARVHQALLRRGSAPGPAAGQLQHSFGVVGILGIAFFTWSFSFAVITSSFAKVVQWLLGEQDRSSAAGEALSQLQIARLPVLDLISILGNAFGVTILIVGWACLLVGVVLVGQLGRRQLSSQPHFTFAGAFMTTMAVTVAMFLVSTSERHPIRLLRILVILSLCAIAWWCWEAIFSPGGSALWPRLSPTRRRLASGATYGLLAGAIVMGQLNLYPHPRNGQPNGQVTRGEMAGMAWLIEHRGDPMRQASVLPQYVSRFEAAFLGYVGLRAARDRWWEPEIWLPSHFYAPGQRCMAELAPGTTAYLALSDAGRIGPERFPQAVRHLAHQYTPEDWQALAADRSVSKLYDNGGFEVWMTHKDSAPCP